MVVTLPKHNYETERQGQIEFFRNFKIPYLDDDSILVDNTDGVYHGNILEFKLNITNTGKVLFQAIKYLSKLRIKGQSVPSRILLIDLNDTKVYEYHSKNYLDDIQTIYIGSASKDNDAFSKDVTPHAIYDYSNLIDADKVKKLLINKVENITDWYIPIDIDENCIVGWAERYYKEMPTAKKGDFLGDGTGKININGEIRDPRHFKGLINSYQLVTNAKFKYLMDCLNDKLNKKDLGAYYTPKVYCQKAVELVKKAVAKVPDGNDYVIIDRCAGTGNLESALIGEFDKNGDELISHCVVSTYEYYEYKVLSERIGDRVKNIIPPTEANVIYENGKISNADAMTKDYIENPLIMQYVNDDKYTIILLENPPYDDSSSIRAYYDEEGNKHITKNKESFVYTQMKDEKNTFKNSNISTVRDFANRFIWSAFKYYLRQETDSYIVFSPVKYFKSIGLINSPHHRFESGFLFNRKHFHASPSAISCVLWSYGINRTPKDFVLKTYDIDKDNQLIQLSDSIVKEIDSPFSAYNEKYVGKSKTIISCDSKGKPVVRKQDTVSYNDSDVIGYFCQGSASFHLGRLAYFNGRGMFITTDNLEKVCPLFATKMFPQSNWFEKDFYFTASDRGEDYIKDKEFLKSSLLYTCLSHKNNCLSFKGQDDIFYRNEICLDFPESETIAFQTLQNYQLDNDEKGLLNLWSLIMSEAKKCEEFEPQHTYGTYEIELKLNKSWTEGVGKNKKTIYKYPILNSYIVSLKEDLKEYYNSHLLPKIFEYELLK